jgi:hypothetical protein
VRNGLLDTIDKLHFYPTIEVAITAFFDEKRADERN